MNPSVYERLKRNEKIEKVLDQAANLTALTKDRSLEKFAPQLERENLLTDSVEIYSQLTCDWYIEGLDFVASHWRNRYGTVNGNNTENTGPKKKVP